ncbi:hypothetical protein halTADL_1294 [Halohasta litchfieldiae]|jgi:flagellar biosynthesis/type III secretory pathway M-ring protein FliF/YscJ|nr:MULTISPECIES: hypothetical protein [Halorubraceae]ATW88072.1 hypothetical protein halTADL_1294 [Halohasta litchfieldiae]SEJ03005.1 hypothetical protein SAMN05444271_1179 [Halohasta litchfieldiae]
MGLKSGSRDAGLDDSESDVDQSTEKERNTPQTESEEDADPSSTEIKDEHESTPSSTSSETESQRPTMDSIPYKLRRDKVNEGREQVPYFLREGVLEAEDELQDTLEELLGEKVYKSDYREASMVVAQRNPELIAEVLREWGYDLDEI